MPPLALSDSELAAIMNAAKPIPPERRDGFLLAVASELKRCGEIGPGSVGRAIRAVQRQYFDPPNLTHEHAPRWSSRRRNGVRASAEG
jgi:hypothetical protein